MSATAIEPPYSVPRYPSVHSTRTAPCHVLVSQGTAQAERQARQAIAADVTTSQPHLNLTDYPDLAALHLALRERLHQAHVGLRLYLCGDETFAWPLQALAREAGMRGEEIVLLCEGSSQRAVYCVHCATIQPGRLDDRLTCHCCGVLLEVRRHFSQRLGAYLGVCADVEQPYAQVRP
ncbi:dimethylamine monooxygenase subunit DmmA family protein [Ectopseudomonas alcaliphila]|uniref:dimethylamine monooxygenase subunit DmmA family protein n=1 Tax=Ectopseudomonas alcaliphila TaxID=101564 RepID=UPI002781BE90|nr:MULTISPECIES: dimethylamine monooxygenase subunit DmmA family protein [Pseudomonas]MDP9940238.1 hypothetical protein [Pseudomonas sp. 3400]MDR7012196.1 hypothetical protein [Pseudomonas alcaliphila]